MMNGTKNLLIGLGVVLLFCLGLIFTSIPVFADPPVVGSQTGTITYGTPGSATYTITLSPPLSGPVTLQIISSLPSGVTPTWGTYNSPGTSTFTLNYDGSTSAGGPTIAGSTIFTIQAKDGTNTLTNTGTLYITPATLAVNGLSASNKTYDGNTNAAITGSGSLGGVISGDTVNLGGTPVGSFVDKNVGNNKTVTISGLSLSGTDSGNYTLTPPSTTANITQRSITVTAGSSSKTYDGLLTSTDTPTLTAGTLASGDTGTWVETYDNKNVGTTHVMTPSGTVKDGSSTDVTANYNITFTPISTGIISQRSITVTAGASSKTYDGLLTSPGTPTVTTGTLGTGDTGNWVETYDNKNVGTSHVMTVTPAVVNDGNGGAN